ncbi:MAG: BolA family transcriptional regulator [Gammaproteobacteria bacterium]|nr:BolA family transcriptional regulator [Gammaproteobacteria bacterium]
MSLNQQRIKAMRQKLEVAFSPNQLEIIDESHKHVGHAGAREGRGHFKLIIAAKIFNDKSLIESHRLIYQALDQLMQTDIHALSIELLKS